MADNASALHFFSYGESGGARGSGSAAWGNSKQFELWTLKFKSTREMSAACDVTPSVFFFSRHANCA